MKVLVLSSGGIDSSTCLALAVNKYGRKNVTALSMFYGQKHDRELKAAEDIAEYYKVKHIVMDLTSIFSFSDSSLLKSSNKSIPKGSYKTQQFKEQGKTISTYVPFRNGLFLSCAASIALSKNCELIYYGAHSDDAAGNAYPDCSTAFNNAMNTAIFEGSGQQLQIEAPFIEMNKADVVKTGLALNVPYELTWSCYEGEKIPCGICATCIDRAKAFMANGVSDPIMTYK